MARNGKEILKNILLPQYCDWNHEAHSVK